MENKFEVLSGREQLLRRPQMWIGSMDPISQEMFIISDNKVERKTVTFTPGFRKIQDEILDNCIDVLIEKCGAKGEIKVKMTNDSVCIEDNGPGIPVIKNDVSKITDKTISESEKKILAESYLPLTAWTRLFSGSNFQDSDSKITIGSHGIGSKACSVFSTKFIGTTDDGKKHCVVTCKNNLESKDCKVSRSSGKSGTKVEFWPDLKRFKLEKIDQVYMDLMYQRLISLSITFPCIKFSFNGKRINVNDKKFLNMFSDNIEFQTFDRGFIGVFPNAQDEFNFFTYVNGLYLSRGGSHIDFITNQIISPVRDKLAKKYKTIKPADVRNRMTVVVFMRDFANPKFDSQTKETLTNSPSEISKYLGDAVDFEKLAKQILKNNAIIDPVVDMFKIKEELKSKHALKRATKARIKSDKYFPGIGEKKYLFLVEGLSAGGGLMKCLGRDKKYFYCLRGLALNVYDSSIHKIAANQEVKDIVNILNIDLTKDGDKEVDFEKIIIATDQDLDGIHISSMLLGWWKRLAPNLFRERKICRLNTPLVILKDNKDNIKKWFFKLNEFKDWEKANPDSKLKIIYLKGLGSLETSDLDFIIDKTGFDSLLEEYYLDDKSDKLMDDWLGSNSEPRKEYLKKYTFDINMI